MLEIDGSQGEGGGQALRTSLSLSALTGRPFCLFNIRAGRSKPGLRPQHLTAVRAAAAICQAEVSGAALNSHTLTFAPQVSPQGGNYLFDVAQAAQGGSAGSVSLILQTVLWPLLFAERPSQVILRGGTHVPFSPTFHYLAETAGPAFTRLGAAFASNSTPGAGIRRAAAKSRPTSRLSANCGRFPGSRQRGRRCAGWRL
jgi:RNA 3'-terminal phosphate cyclase (ATP)